MSRLPKFLDNQLTDGSEVVSLMRWPAAFMKAGLHEKTDTHASKNAQYLILMHLTIK
jgi:hypothetical protein